MKTWANADPTDHWEIELEDDVFSEAEGRVVSLFIKNTQDTAAVFTTESGLATLLPDTAREVAAELLRLADHVETSRAAASAGKRS